MISVVLYATAGLTRGKSKGMLDAPGGNAAGFPVLIKAIPVAHATLRETRAHIYFCIEGCGLGVSFPDFGSASPAKPYWTRAFWARDLAIHSICVT